jgi:hypothetical protein
MTVAINVVDWPAIAGLGETVSVVVDAAWAMVTVVAVEVDDANLPSLA